MSYLDHPFLEWPSDGHACSTPRCPSGEHVGRQAATGPTILHSTKSLCLSITAQRKDAPSELLNMHQFGNIRRRSTQEFRVVFFAETSKNPRYCDPGQMVMSLPTVHRDARGRAAEARRPASASTTPLFNLHICYNARDMKPHLF